MSVERSEGYDQAFYNTQMPGSLRSAEIVLEMLWRMQRFDSIADIGCGAGTWLKAAADLGATTLVGVDGDYVDKAQIVVAPEAFVAADLEAPLPDLKAHGGVERFDLAISMETAEQLTFARAASFVEELCALSDVVLFSAAVPFQGGHDHFNEQWPEFWALLFRCCGFACHDALRPHLWGDARVEWWYQQNVLLFVRRSAELSCFGPETLGPLAQVHPDNYLAQITKWFYRHRYVAAAEEEADLAALTHAFRDPEGRLPPLRALERAAAYPGAVDVFPATRIDRFSPETAIADLEARIERLHSENTALRGRLDETS